jgi:hypothetical protein
MSSRRSPCPATVASSFVHSPDSSKVNLVAELGFDSLDEAFMACDAANQISSACSGAMSGGRGSVGGVTQSLLRLRAFARLASPCENGGVASPSMIAPSEKILAFA